MSSAYLPCTRMSTCRPHEGDVEVGAEEEHGGEERSVDVEGHERQGQERPHAKHRGRHDVAALPAAAGAAVQPDARGSLNLFFWRGGGGAEHTGGG
jgi:hypothetical protein